MKEVAETNNPIGRRLLILLMFLVSFTMLHGQLTLQPECRTGTGCEIPDTVKVLENGVAIGMILTDSLSCHLTQMTVSGNRIFFAGTSKIPWPFGRPHEFELYWVVLKVKNHVISLESKIVYDLGKYKDDWIEFPINFAGHSFEICATLEEHGTVGMGITVMMYGEKEFDEFIRAFLKVVRRRPKLRPFSVKAFIDAI